MNQPILQDLKIPAVTTDQMRAVDRMMIGTYGISLVQMMENAGRNLADLARRLLGGLVRGKKVVVACGSGNNGGGGLVAARNLYNWGAGVLVLLPDKGLKGVSKQQAKILENLSITLVRGGDALEHLHSIEADIILDALIGYGLSGPPHGWASRIIRAINHSKASVLSLDVPSGLNATSGEIYDPCVKADSTMTLALPKTGLMAENSGSVIGTLYLADISVPRVLYKTLGLDVGAIFNKESIVNIDHLRGE